MAKRKQHDCHHCGTSTQESNGGFRFCGAECEKQHDMEHRAIRECLKAEGFMQSAETPNIWAKDGVLVTEELLYEGGVADGLAKHQAVVANPSVPIKPLAKSKPWRRQ